MRFLPQLDPNELVSFLLALGAAIVIVFFYSYRRFGEPTVERSSEDFVTQLLPKYLATKEEYSGGLLTYIASMILILVAFSLLGPPVLNLVGVTTDKVPGLVIPIVVAFALVGLLPNVRYLKDIEWHIRYFAHQRAFIPAAALATAETLTAAGFDFSQYRETEALAEMEGVDPADFDRPRGSTLYDWARLSCLLYALKSRYDAYLDGEMLNRYEHDLDGIYQRRQSLLSAAVEFKRMRLENPRYTDERLRQQLRIALWQLYILVGCAARRKLGQGEDICGVQTGLWWPSADFPAKAYETFIWSISAGITHGAAIFGSEHIRSSLNRKDRWFSTQGSVRAANPANYVRVAVGCGVVGFVVISLWSLLFQTPTWGLVQGASAFALLPAATGAFYAYHLDNVELGTRPPRRWEILAQALVTGAAGFIAAGVWLSLGETAWTEGLDWVLLVTVLGTVVGASLGWYLPDAAATRKYNPLNDAKKERALSLEAMATERFDSYDTADEWLKTPLPLLKGIAPIAAAATIEGYQDAVALLHRPTQPAPAM